MPALPACVLAGCKEDQETAAPPAARPARVAVVTPHKLELVAQGAGRIEARYVSQVGFEVGGRLISRDVDIGTVVTKGQKLARAQRHRLPEQGDRRRGRPRHRQGHARPGRSPGGTRSASSLDKGYTPRSVYDESLKSLRSAEAAVQAAEANLRIAQNQLGYTQLLAPNDGVVTATGADPGQVVEAGQMVVEISRDAEREAVFAVAGADVARATLGMPVKVWLQAQPDVAVTGTIREISPVADSTTGTYEVKVALPSAPPEMRLGAIVVGRAESRGPGSHDPARRPRSCNPETMPQVWVVSKDNQVHRRTVELLEFDMDSVVVGAGLSPGEMVVTAGVNSLADGQDVKPETEVE